MTKVLITGMSGTGKSSVLRELGRRGHRVVDTDTDEWSEWVVLADGSRDWIWREDAVADLLRDDDLYVAGCKSNQGKFYPSFDHIVLLSAPIDVLLARIAARADNPYGKSPAEQAEIRSYVETVEPLLRATATTELDATAPLAAVADQLERLS